MRRGLCCLIGMVWACTPAPPRTSFARYPGAPAEQDPSQSDPRALAVADRVFFAAGGQHWERARELRWTRTPVTVDPRPRRVSSKHSVSRSEVEPDPRAPQDHRWDRWNGRYGVRTHHEGLDTFMVVDLHGPRVRGLVEHVGHAPIQVDDVRHGSGGVRASWHAQTALLVLPLLVREPGARLEYLGRTHDETGDFERLRLTFSPEDPLRSAAALELIVDEHDAIAQVTIATATAGNTYDLRDRVTVAGLAIPTTQLDLATGEITRISNIEITATVDDSGYFP
jgi:hypothetical protein